MLNGKTTRKIIHNVKIMKKVNSINYFSADKFIQLDPLSIDVNYLLEDIDDNGFEFVYLDQIFR